MDVLKAGDKSSFESYGFSPETISNGKDWILEKVAEGQIVGQWNQGLWLHFDPEKNAEFVKYISEEGMEVKSPIQVEGVSSFWDALEYFTEGSMAYLLSDGHAVAFPSHYHELLAEFSALAQAAELPEGDESTDPYPLPSDLSEKAGQDPFLLNQLGKLYAMTRNVSLAGETFRKLLEAHPGYSEAYGNMGTLLWRFGSRREAFMLFVESMLKNPHRTVNQLNFFDSGYELKEYAAMAKVLETVLPAVPECVELRHHLAMSYCHLGRVGEAKALLESIMASHPDDEEARQILDEIQKLETTGTNG